MQSGRLLVLALATVAGEDATTTVVFSNVAACATLASIKFDFPAPTPTACPVAFRTLDGSRCQVPGPYGIAVVVELTGVIESIPLQLLNPSADDANLTGIITMQLDPMQRRNLVGAVVSSTVAPDACATGLQVFSDADTPPIAEGRFRTMFRHAAVNVGDADVRTNGDSTFTTLAPGGRYLLDQMLLSEASMPTPIAVSFATAQAEAAAEASTRLWPTTCERSVTSFVLFGAPAAGDFPLQVLRVDGAGTAQCSYGPPTVSNRTSELALYNAVPSSTPLIFGFGVSPFLPLSQLRISEALSWKQKLLYEVAHPGEIYVKAFSAINTAAAGAAAAYGPGSVLVNAVQVTMNAQPRNIVGAAMNDGGTARLDVLQAATNQTIAADHFRLIFVHSANGYGAVSVHARDDTPLMQISPGESQSFDNSLIAPHAAGQLVKITFQTSPSASTSISASILIDLSTLCDGAAYTLTFVGTANRLDSFDPQVVKVDGSAAECSLSTAPVLAGECGAQDGWAVGARWRAVTPTHGPPRTQAPLPRWRY